MQPVTMLDSRNNLSKRVAAAENGDDVVIAKRGRPVVRLVPVEQNRLTGAVFAEQLVRNPPPNVRTATEIDDEGERGRVVRQALADLVDVDLVVSPLAPRCRPEGRGHGTCGAGRWRGSRRA